VATFAPCRICPKKLMEADQDGSELGVFRCALGDEVPSGADTLERSSLLGVGGLMPVTAIELGEEAGLRVIKHAVPDDYL
jgi:hypothetical protein